MARYLTNNLKRAWAEIDLKKAKENYVNIKSKLNSKICCVVKADAYGHGASLLCKLYQELGCDYFAVSNINEGIELRKANINTPILILGYTPPPCANLLYKYNLTQTIFSTDYFLELEKQLKDLDVKIKAHIKIDTGMNRLGFDYKKCKSQIFRISKSKYFYLEGIFTHFCSADEKRGRAFTKKQFDRFNCVVEKLNGVGVEFELKHCSSTFALPHFPHFQMDMVRIGLGLYGYPTNEMGLTPILELKTVIAQIKEVKKGEKIGYGGAFITTKNIKVATLPIGYADGFFRAGKSVSLVRKNTPVKILGRVCMDMLMVDVSNVDCAVGDEVVVIGKNNFADKLSGKMGTICYELLSLLSKRVPRIYIS